MGHWCDVLRVPRVILLIILDFFVFFFCFGSTRKGAGPQKPPPLAEKSVPPYIEEELIKESNLEPRSESGTSNQLKLNASMQNGP